MLTIHMHKDGRVQLVDKEQTPHKTRYVSLEDMVEAFRGQAMSSPVLPDGCVQYWRGHGYEIVTVKRDAHKRKMSFYDEDFDLPVPGIIMAFRLNGEGDDTYLSESAIYSFPGMWMGENTQLCGFPYGNVFEENNICWGEIEFNELKLHQLTGMPDIFLSSPFNDDLSGHYQNPSSEDQGLRSFWDEMSGKDFIPADRFRPVCLYSELPSTLGALFH